MKKIFFYWILWYSSLGYWACTSASKQNNSQENSPALVRLFEADDMLRMGIEANFEKLFADTSKNRKWIDGKLWVDTSVFDIELKMRGNLRKDPDVCDFPPLFIKFKKHKKQNENTIFEGYKKLKLVTHCTNGDSAISEKYVCLEKIVYDMYKNFSPFSFRTRLARITYTQTQNQKKIERLAFFIEDIDDVAERNAAQEHQGENLTQDSLVYAQLTDFGLFHYMISNSDWSIRSQHNVKFIQQKENIFIIPYDFDGTGFVNVPYTLPHPYLKSEDLTQRVYRGFWRSEREIQESLQKFRQKQTDFEKIVNSSVCLSREEKQKAWAYLLDFYTIIADSVQVKKHIIDKGR